ncbi:MAG: ComF family protein [Bacteroides sp.]|nr:ComF family protein [Bacteroides sp.]MCM1379380.1 ComF family protein [Bacteroides sp.]MCM1445240.1 ComF family protein [Prevotella sp.]
MSNLLIGGMLDVLFPPLCPCCGAVMTRGEGPMCLGCRINLPLTGFEKNPADNDLTEKLQGLVPIEAAVAYFFYRRNAPQDALIHDMKYRGRPTIGRQLAREYSRKLAANGFFDTVEVIVPVPLNFWHHCRRGFNQTEWIARGIRDVTALPIIDGLKARRHTSQTRRNARARQRAACHVYSAKSAAIAGLQHILLVDDICTTGATLYACAEALHNANPTAKISIFALAATSLI